MDPKLVEKLKSVSTLNIADDKLSATLEINVFEDELSEVTEEEVRQLLKKNNITYGIIPESLSEILSKIKRGPAQIGPLVIAKGVPPEKGEEGELTLEFSQQLQVGEAKHDGRMDYRERGAVREVSEGEIIASVKLPTEGKPGRSIENKIIQPPKTKRFKLPKAGSAVKYVEKENKYIAEKAGNIFFVNNEFSVTPDFVIPGDVDYSVGNIHFSGNVIIMGTIRKGFVVEAEGAITVEEDVEPKSELIAGKDITIKGTCRGKGKHTPPFVKTGENLFLSSINEASVFSSGDVIVSGLAISSSVYCLGKFSCCGEEAEIRGCSIEAVSGIKAVKIGSPDGEANSLVAGITANVAKRIEEIKEELNRLNQHISHVFVAFNKRNEKLLKKPNHTDKEKQQLQSAKETANAKQEDLENKVRDLTEELSGLQEKYADDPGAIIEIQGEIYPVANIHVYQHDYVLSSKSRENVVFYDSERNVICQGKEEYEKQKQQKASDPDEIIARFKRGRLNPSQLVSGLEKYNASGSFLIIQTALAVGLKAVKQREFQNPAIWCETARSLVLITRGIGDKGKKEGFLKKAELSANNAMKLSRDSPGPIGVLAMIAAARGDLKNSLFYFKKAVAMLKSGKKRTSFKREVSIFALYADTLKSIASNLENAGKNKEAAVITQEAQSMAEEYLKRQSKGAWVRLAKSITEKATVKA